MAVLYFVSGDLDDETPHSVLYWIITIIQYLWTYAALYYFLLTKDGLAIFRIPTLLVFLKGHILRMLIVFIAIILVGVIFALGIGALIYSGAGVQSVFGFFSSIGGSIVSFILLFYLTYLGSVITGHLACWIGHDLIEKK